jgi:hypothetical protein
MPAERVTLSTKVNVEFAQATSFFADHDHMTLSQFIQTSLVKSGVRVLQELNEKRITHLKTAHLMSEAIDGDTWEAMIKAKPGVYPETLEGWKKEVASHEEAASGLMEDVMHMKSQLKDMGMGIV